MKFSKYIKDNYLTLLLFSFIIAIIELILITFETNKQAIIGVAITAIIGCIVGIVYNFERKRKFYNKFLNDLDLLDKKYLITEMIEKPDFYEGIII